MYLCIVIDLSSHIEYLLLRHDCVVVPGLGAFLVHEEPAHFDADSSMFYPPCRSLGFNPVVTHNDGLLVESVAKCERITIEMAAQNVQAEVSAFRHQLSMSGELPVGTLGVMSLGSEPDVLLFEPASDAVALSMPFVGLSPISCRPIAEEDLETEETSRGEESRPRMLSLPFKIAASFIFVLVACGLLYSTTDLPGGIDQAYASLDSGLSDRSGQFIAEPSEETHSLSREIILNIAMPDEKNMEMAVAAVDQPKQSAGRYLLVVASFPTKEAAERHIRQVGATDLSIAEMDGNFRVYAGSCRTSAEAYSVAESIRAAYPYVWVCRR